MAVGEAKSDAVARGIAWLVENQADDGLWGQEHYTGGASRSLLPALSWLSALFPALGSGTVSQHGAGQCGASPVGNVNGKPVIAVTGTLREAAVLNKHDVVVMAGAMIPNVCAKN
jgi:hypothetical protein